MDVLADVLSATRIGNTILCGAEFEIPWGIRFDPEPRTHFHFVSRGTCWLRLNEQAPPMQLFQGDVAGNLRWLRKLLPKRLKKEWWFMPQSLRVSGLEGSGIGLGSYFSGAGSRYIQLRIGRMRTIGEMRMMCNEMLQMLAER